MPRVHFIKKARKDYPNQGIKKGDSYYYWTFRYGGKCKSLTSPRPSQLTSSDFLSTMYTIQEEIEDLSTDNYSDGESLETFAQEKADEIRSLGEEQSDKQSNMPDSLQDSPTGELLEERANACEEMADELENIDTDVEELFFEEVGEAGECNRCDNEGKYETGGAEVVCEGCLKDVKNEHLQSRVGEIIEEIQGIDYAGE